MSQSTPTQVVQTKHMTVGWYFTKESNVVRRRHFIDGYGG